MIGHFLLTLTPEQEDRVLTTVMKWGHYTREKYQGPCLIGVAMPSEELRAEWHCRSPYHDCCLIEARFDAVCQRFSTARITAAIRTRILTNRFRRLANCETQSARDRAECKSVSERHALSYNELA